MSAQAVLIAETDPATLDILPRIMSDNIHGAGIDICTSADELSQKLRHCSYDIVAMTPLLLQDYRKHKKRHQLLAPLLVTTAKIDRAVAHTALEEDAFDVIVKPIVEPQVAHTVKLALWHSELLRLLASKERAVSRFREHIEAFPNDLKGEAEFQAHLAAFERTCRAVSSSIRLLESIDSPLYDLAASVEFMTRKHALDRLLNMC
jgi:DNA-binding NtrC family response regulator